MKVYKSKVDKIMVVLLSIPFLILALSVASEINRPELTPNFWVAVFSFLFTLVLYIFICNIRYIIDGENLIVKISFIKQVISIKEIATIEKSSSLLSSPALSFDRIRIADTMDVMMALISPKDLDAFCRDLKEVNPAIKIMF